VRLEKEKRQRRSYFNERGRQRKLALIKLMGGCCERCGYDKSPAALDFHHIDPNIKEFGIASNLPHTSWGRILAEVAKCQLLCANCHRELRFGEE